MIGSVTCDLMEITAPQYAEIHHPSTEVKGSIASTSEGYVGESVTKTTIS